MAAEHLVLLDSSYFIGDINIVTNNNSYGPEKIDVFIWRHEPEYLRLVLGHRFYRWFNDWRMTPADDQYLLTQLAEGAEWVDRYGVHHHWAGFKPLSGKITPVAYYVFYHYCRHTMTLSTGIGEVQPKAENGQVVSPAQKMVDAWNRMVELNIQLVSFLAHNESLYAPYWQWPGVMSAQRAALFQKINILNI